MFKIFLYEGCLSRTLKYLGRIILPNLTHKMSMIDCGHHCGDTKFVGDLRYEVHLINCMNLRMVLNPTINHIDSYHDYVCGPFV